MHQNKLYRYNFLLVGCLFLLCFMFIQNILIASTRIIHPHRAPKTLEINNDGFNVLMSYRGQLEGNITHNPIENPALRDKDNRIVYGFTNPKDRITWTVNVPETAKYKVAVQYTGKMYLSDNAQSVQNVSKWVKKRYDPECIVSIQSNGQVLTTELKRVTLNNEPDKMAGSRQWLEEPLFLQKGKNQIILNFSKLSDHQIKAAKKELKEGTLKKSTISLGIKSIELIRPESWTKMNERAKALKADTQWMVDGKYGLFIHWSLKTYPLYGNQQAFETFEWGVNTFDVEIFADRVEQTGASWVLFTTCHGRQMFPAPIQTLEKLLPDRTTKRDLISALAAALKQRNIKLLLYYNFSSGDVEFANAVGMTAENPQKWFQYIIDFGKETSQRYGKDIAGWGYFDGSVTGYELNFPWEEFVKAFKSGNPDAVVGISSHWWGEFTPFNDLQTVDSGKSMIEPLNPVLYQPGGRYEGLQQHFSFVLDGSWIPREPYNGIIRSNSKTEGGPIYPVQDYIDYFVKMDKANVPITVNMLITQDVTKNQMFVNPQTLDLLKQIRQKLWGR